MKKPEGAIRSMDEIRALVEKAKGGETVRLYEVYVGAAEIFFWENTLGIGVVLNRRANDGYVIEVEKCTNISGNDLLQRIFLNAYPITEKIGDCIGCELFSNMLLARAYWNRMKAKHNEEA